VCLCVKSRGLRGVLVQESGILFPSWLYELREGNPVGSSEL
jgi:hypothetical protein